MDNRKLLMFGFIACILAALAYTFVFADLPFATPETPEAAAPAREAAPRRHAVNPHASTP